MKIRGAGERPLIEAARQRFHADLLAGPLSQKDGVPAIADKASRPSVATSRALVDLLGRTREKAKQAGQSSGSDFEKACRDFLASTFLRLPHLRPGNWKIYPCDGELVSLEGCEQFTHLLELEQIARENPRVRALLGNDYTIKPDVLIARMPEPDEVIDAKGKFVAETLSRQCALREIVNPLPILHASISCKWTLRSDRAQNARTEALNLIRNRKGRVPHISVVTAEPMPGRLASLAIGTGDIDCVYHFALYELREAVAVAGSEDSAELLTAMIEGKRLKDISDLPLDLAI